MKKSTQPLGYSGTPLAKKLGLKAPLTFFVVNAPEDYADWLGELDEGVTLVVRAPKMIEAAHLFLTERAQLEHRLTVLRGQLAQSGFVWVSWPKKASKVATDITEDTIREIALPLGFVDIKVCAVSAVWSGLKLVIRKRERTA